MTYDSFVGMICHLIFEETYFCYSFAIGCIPIKGSHKYQNITEVITELQKRTILIYHK